MGLSPDDVGKKDEGYSDHDPDGHTLGGGYDLLFAGELAVLLLFRSAVLTLSFAFISRHDAESYQRDPTES